MRDSIITIRMTLAPRRLLAFNVSVRPTDNRLLIGCPRTVTTPVVVF